MADSNPYASPKTKSASSGDPPPRRTRFVYYVVPALVGAVAGGIFLAPYCRSIGDPGGHSIGSGLGGLAALFVGFVFRIVSSSNTES